MVRPAPMGVAARYFGLGCLCEHTCATTRSAADDAYAWPHLAVIKTKNSQTRAGAFCVNRAQSKGLRTKITFKNKKAPDPDKIKADALKLGGYPFLIRYKSIANYLLLTGYYPSRLKIGEYIFLHKANKNQQNAKSYRPITLLNVMGKLHKYLPMSHLRQTADRLQPLFQHGFIRNRETGTQILRTGKFITDTLEAKESVTMVSMDLWKAFDFINHEGLMKKLQTADIPNKIIKVKKNYLSSCKTYGCFRTNNGDEKSVPQGVSQVSSLGPVTFNLYVHDIWDQWGCTRGLKLSQYADDLCILNRSPNPN
ncbi:RNA-directed DNA polymerase from mobile element jockey [Eumeta japonica]|uniref:RNA-directed DNA polymerase from mobile element jockey n=1 Tax=Eumeta variegata TaxID=151549 RepID=A0A4C1TQQ7_EUMVA|nr:RNA-directed DNA polymerase from mobile element jockey [Eumeta japonica]